MGKTSFDDIDLSGRGIEAGEISSESAAAGQVLTADGAGGAGWEAAAGGGPGYLVYVALLTQSGTDAPVATVMENTLGGTVVWTRDNEGQYRGTLTNAFPLGKTVVFPKSFTMAAVGGAWFATAEVSHNSVSDFTLSWITTDGYTDDLPGICMEIRVYP